MKASELLEKLQDPVFFIERLQIVDNHGKVSPLRLRWPQRDALQALSERQYLMVLKARQLGFTTLTTAYMLHRALFVAEHDYDVLCITHEMAACGRVNLMLKNFIRWLPDILRPKITKDNAQEVIFKTWDGRTCALRQVMAGGRSQGRSYTYRALHFTEAGFYPRGSAHNSGSAVDEDLYASALSTLHQDEHTRLIMESTANGPVGLFHKMVLVARESQQWSFRFYPWYLFDEYRRPVPEGWERTDDEQEHAELHGLDDEQLAFRRGKIIDDGYGLTRFRKEYPATWMEPFLATGGAWFNYDVLNEWLSALGHKATDKEGLRVYLEPEPGRKYFMGGDTSGGTGGDSGVWMILRDDFAQACVYSSRELQPRQFAEMGCKLFARYKPAAPVVEANHYGHSVIKRMRELGVHCWTDDKGKPWWTDPKSKVMAYDFARAIVDQRHTALVDPLTIRECMNVREQDDGAIEADEGRHDDHPMALALALWAGRRQYSGQAERVLPVHLARVKRHKELGLGVTGGANRR